MIDLTQCAALGSITKTHGVHGQVVLRLKHVSSDRINKMEWVFIEQDGLPVPFFVNEYYESNPNTLVLTLDGLESPDKARELTDVAVWISKKDLGQADNTQGADDPALLIGYSVIDSKLGEIGILDDILDFDQNPLFRIMRGKQEILIPVKSEFIVEVNDTEKTIRVQTPEGLLDLF